jgi:predicted outer membrane protein
MLRRIPRFLRVSIVLAILAAVAVTVYQSWQSGVVGTGGWTQTQWGPLGPADRDLLVKVRQANLWEAPTGQQASQQASSPAVREVGAHLATEHADLDAQTRKVADQLGVLLPAAPNAQQQGWMTEISAATGSDYDRIFIQRVRQAHGIVLPLLAQDRVSTRNSLMRDFATVGMQFVNRHIGYLESTGLVDYNALPAAPDPSVFTFTGAPGGQDLVMPTLVILCCLIAAGGFVAAFRRKKRSNKVVSLMADPPRRAPAPTPIPEFVAIPGPRPPSIDPHPSLPLVLPGEASGPRHAVRPRVRN